MTKPDPVPKYFDYQQEQVSGVPSNDPPGTKVGKLGRGCRLESDSCKEVNKGMTPTLEEWREQNGK